MKNEVNRAFGEGKPIITFRIEDVMPGRSLQLYLARHHWTDAFPPPVDPHVDRLAASISKLLNAAAEDSTTAAIPKPAAGGTIRIEAPRTPPSSRPAASRIGFRRWGLLGAILAGVLIVGAMTWHLKPSPPSPPVTRFTIALTDNQFLPRGGGRHLAISPDGTRIVYIVDGRLHLRSLSEFESRPIPGSEVRPSDPVLSPDGRSIAFVAGSDRTLKTIGVTGGAPVTLCPMRNVGALNWGPDGFLYILNRGVIQRVSEQGGTPETLVTVEDGRGVGEMQMLPGGQTVLFALSTGSDRDRWEKAKVIAQKVKSGERKVLIEGGTDPHYLPTGHLLFVREGVVFAVRFDAKRLEIAGTPMPVLEGVRRSRSGDFVSSVARFIVSETGTAIYVPGPVTATAIVRSLGFFDRKDAAELIKVPPGPYEHPRLSPDGQRIAFGSDNGAIWIYDLSGASAVRRLTLAGQGLNRYPVWSADSQRVTFQSDREKDLGLFWQRADGAGAAERLVTAAEGTELVPESWSPDGGRLLYCARKRDGTSALSVWSVDAKKSEPFAGVVTSALGLTGAAFSPDGRWVAYASREGRASNAVYVQPFPATGAKYQISRDAEDGHHPI